MNINMLRWYCPDLRLLLCSERVRRLSKEGFWILAGQTMAVLGSLVGVRLLTELLDPVAYGELTLGMTLATLINQTLLGPLGNGITRFYAPAKEQGDLGDYLNATHNLVLSATGIIVAIILLTVTGLFLAWRTEWIAITTAALIFAALSGYNSILSGIQNAARQRSIVALHKGMDSWVRFLVAAGLLLWLGSTSTYAMVGYSVAAILVLGSQYVFFRKIVPKNATRTIKERYWREQMCKYSWPFATWGIVTWLQLTSDRWALELFGTTRDVGMYAVLFQIGYYPMSILTGMAMNLLAPIFYQRAGDASDGQRILDIRSLNQILISLVLGLAGIAFLVGLMLHGQIFQIFVSREYVSVSHLLPWMLLAGGLFATGQTIELYISAQMKTRTLIAPKIVTAVLGVTFNYVGAYWNGITGVVMAGVVFSISYFLWMLVLSKHKEAT